MQNLSFNYNGYSFEGEVITKKKDGYYTSRCKYLDLEGYGNTKEEALESFRIRFKEYLQYTLTNNTLCTDLSHLGYSVQQSGNEITACKSECLPRIYMQAYTPDIRIKVCA